MLLKNLVFTMAMAAFVDMLLSVGFANAVLTGNSFFRDGDTLFAPNAHGETVAHRIVNMTSEIGVPGSSAKVNITGTAEEVIAYINANFPDYVWPDVEELNTTASKVTAEDNTVYCNVGRQGYLFVAAMVMRHLRHIGRRSINVGAGPSACVVVSCRTDSNQQTIAIWWCNDGASSASTKYNTIADLAQIVLKQCVEFGTPYSWIRGQAFDTSNPWNVIVSREDSCK